MKRNGCTRNECAGIDQTRHRLEQLTRSDRASLVAYAQRRLSRVGLDPDLAEDMTQDAFQAILLGLETQVSGRHPRTMDVESRESFIDYLGGVVNSLVAYERGKRRYRFEHEPIGLPKPDEDDDAQLRFEIQSADQVEREAGWNDLQAAFFARLKPRAFQQLQPILADWETEWRGASKIPVPIPQRRFRRTVRRLAKEVLEELGEALAA